MIAGGKGKKGQEVKKTYQTQPPIKDKFRPADAKIAIENVIETRLKSNAPGNPADYPVLCKDLAEKSKNALRALEKDKRYKYLVQVLVGMDQGQGVQMGTRQFWDPELDHVVKVTQRKRIGENDFFIIICAFCTYQY